ncbi:MAG: response regulator transcription factor [Atopobium sp.]|nr:response regulator transcription factor [Atopobium sp.]
MVYYVEDDKNIRELTLYALRQSSIEAEGFADDVAFRRACAERIPDVVLLDIMLPGTDGLQILRRIRQTPGMSDVAVMMLTAKDTELDTVRALDDGADDYLAKPFGMLEMVSRVRALLRRTKHAGAKDLVDDAIAVGGLEIRPSRREVSVDGQFLELTMREFDLLAFLAGSPRIVFSREELLRRVWGWDFDGGSRTVDVHVQQLRSKLGVHAGLIETVRGVGYRINPDEPNAEKGDRKKPGKKHAKPKKHKSAAGGGDES